jgi:hypothetical protein
MDKRAEWIAKFREDVYWTREKIWQASMAAATTARKWEHCHIIGWSEWSGGDGKRHAVMVLDDGRKLLIHQV